MEAPTLISLLTSLLALTLAWKALCWVWVTPKRVERCLRRQGVSGTPYRLLHGDTQDIARMQLQANATPVHLSHDISPRILPFYHRSIHKYGKQSFMWAGPAAKLCVMEPKMIRDLFTNYRTFQKPQTSMSRSLVSGLAEYEGDKWAKHRKIINPAFHTHKLKNLLPEVKSSCEEMLTRWDQMLQNKGCCELDLMPWFQNLTGDVISRAAFGSNFEEGRRIFQLLKEQAAVFLKAIRSTHLPGWRFLPTKTNKRYNEIHDEINSLITGIIHKKEEAVKRGEGTTDDLLGMLLNFNAQEIEVHGGKKKKGMNLDEIIRECKLFYFAGQETTNYLLVWTMILLSKHQDWQARAREEVFDIFGKNQPTNDGLHRLKTVGMILLEVLRLYPPIPELARTVHTETKLGELSIPPGVILSVPIILVHHDTDIWGEDAHEFKPDRFLEGVSNATQTQPAFLSFGFGPRVCIGQNFAMTEAKAALAMILQRFSFELSPSYVHAPWNHLTVQPQHGAPIIIREI